MNLILCGMMGCGKTTIGRRIEELTGCLRLDTDELIEQTHGKISDIFQTHGEGYFRDLETETLQSLLGKEEIILSTGGGIVLREQNVALLKKIGKVVFLRAEKQTLFERLQADTTRPLLQTGALSERLDTLLEERTALYENAAHVIIDVDNKSVDEIAKEILEN